MVMFWICYAIFHIACGILAYGWSYAYWQRKFPTLAMRDCGADQWFSCFIAALGPAGILVALICGGTECGMLFHCEHDHSQKGVRHAG